MDGTCLLELLNGTLVDTTALVDQVTGGGGLAGIDVADNDDVDVSLVFLTVAEVSMRYSKGARVADCLRSRDCIAGGG
jgi:hypothetical protein